MELLNEVAPPGFGHTKGDKEKGVKKGGTAAAFDKARKEGRFKGSKSDMFAIMWSQKKKGDKPHYKPGTDKKYKKYQEESTMPNVDSKDKKVIKARAKNLFKRDLKGEHQGVNETVKDPTKKKPKAPQCFENYLFWYSHYFTATVLYRSIVDFSTFYYPSFTFFVIKPNTLSFIISKLGIFFLKIFYFFI